MCPQDRGCKGKKESNQGYLIKKEAYLLPKVISEKVPAALHLVRGHLP